MHHGTRSQRILKAVDCRFFDYGVRYKQVQPLNLVDFVITRSHGLLNSIKFPSNRNSSVKEFLRVAERSFPYCIFVIQSYILCTTTIVKVGVIRKNLTFLHVQN